MKPPFYNQFWHDSGVCWGTILLTAGLTLASPHLLAVSPEEIAQNPPSPESSSLENSVLQIARQITVRILTDPGAGSGVIIDRRGDIYTVLTCDHVANGGRDETYEILTPDGQTHVGWRRQISVLQGLDLAVIEFESHNPYRVAILGNLEQISVGEPIYVSGFPNYQPRDDNGLDITYDWGLEAFRFSAGNVSMKLSERSLQRGYQLAYTNENGVGMSGGPVLDRYGQVIGIHGRGRVTIQGIETFRFTDGTLPSRELYERMSPLSWAIPISTFQRLIEPSQTPLPCRNDPSPSPPPAKPVRPNERPETI
ncbi:MAG: S1 family peptidase [Limnospira sp.]